MFAFLFEIKLMTDFVISCTDENVRLTFCQRDGDDHTVSSSYPETISTNQKCCDSHKREAQLASTCELQPESAEINLSACHREFSKLQERASLESANVLIK